MENLKKQKALDALASCATLTEAALQAGISRRTLFNYIHNDTEFARQYAEMRDAQAIARAEAAAVDRLDALACIRSLMNDESQPAAVRLRAACALLDVERQRSETADRITKTNQNRLESPFF